MNCPKCNSIIPQDARFCIRCGSYVAEISQENKEVFESDKSHYNSNNGNSINSGSNDYWSFSLDNGQANIVKKKKTKRKLLLISSAVAVFIIAVSVFSIYYYSNFYIVNKQINSVLAEVESRNFKEAKDIYDKIKNDSSNSKSNVIISSVNKKLNSRVESLTHDYIKNNTDYGELYEWLKGLKEFESIGETINKNESEAKKYKDSRESMKLADKYSEDKDYLEAIKKYKEVIPEDVHNYNDAQSKIDKCTKDAYDYYIKKADELNADGKYEDAYKTAKLIKDYYPEDVKLKSKMDSYLKRLYDSSIKKADEYNSQKKFDEAIETISDAIDYFPGDSVMSRKRESYITNRFKEEQEEKKRRSKRKNELLAKTSKRYDEKTKATVIAPRGYSTRYVNIDRYLCIEPRIIVAQGDIASIMIFTGFVGDKWVNYDKVIFDVDGETFEWEAPLRYKNKQTIFSEIAEWSIHSSLEIHEIVEQLTKVANGKDVKMIFEGDGRKTHVVTKEEKNNLSLFVELYGFYVNISKLIDGEPYSPEFVKV